MKSVGAGTGTRARQWTVNVIGATSLCDGAEQVIELRPKERSVIAALAMLHPEPVASDHIVELVWGNPAPTTARKSLSNHVARVRSVAEGLIVTADLGYRLGDHVTIEDSTSAGSTALAYADLADNDEVDTRRRHIEARQSARYEDELAAELRTGATPALLGRLSEAVDVEPYSERRWQLFAEAQLRLERRRDAMATLRNARRRLSEVGLEPGPLITKLESDVLEGRSAATESGTDPRPPFHRHTNDPFAGRQRETQQLASLWSAVCHGNSAHHVVIEGDAGTGKSRLIDHFAAEIRAADVRFMWGRCTHDHGLPHEGLIDAVVGLLNDDPELEAALGEHAAALRGGRHLDSGADERDSAHDDLLRALNALSDEISDQPTLWVVDDDQWIGADAQGLLTHLLERHRGPLLVVSTRRPYPVPTHAVRMATATISLTAFTRDETTELLDVWGVDSSDNTSHLVHERTAGHAFYVTELARRAKVLDTAVDPLSTPHELQDWIDHRVESMGERITSMLQLAAVAGGSVDSSLLAVCLDRPVEDIEDDCDSAASAGLLAASAPSSQLTFPHELMRQGVYASIGQTRRVRLHRTVHDALAEQSGVPDHARLAFHAGRAGPERRKEATAHARRAGEHSFSAGAWDAARLHFVTALDTGDERLDIATAHTWLGRALAQQGKFDEAAEHLHTAITICRTDGIPRVQAQATLALVGRAGRGAGLGASDAEQTSLIRSALEALGRHQPIDAADERTTAVLTSDLERELAYALLLTRHADERSQLLMRSHDRMRRLDPVNQRALASAILATRYSKLAPDRLAERLDDIETVLSMPRAAIGPEALVSALVYRHEDLLRSGEFDRAADALAEAESILDGYPNAYWSWSASTWRVVLDVLHGHYDRAEMRAFEAFESRKQVNGAEACLAVHLVNIRLYQGRSAEVIPAVEAAIDAHPELPVYRAVHALCASEAGDLEAAAASLRWFADHNIANLPNDTNRLLALGLLAHVAADVGDVEAAAQLTPLLQPFSGQWILINCYGGGGAVWGPASHALSRTAQLLGDQQQSLDDQLQARHEAAGLPAILNRIA